MNGFSCRIGSKHPANSLFSKCEAQAKIETYNVCGAEIITSSNDGNTFAVVDNSEYFCVISGYLQYPLPEWSAGKPVDSAIVAAKYLLNRFDRKNTDFLYGVHGHFVILIISKKRGDINIATDNCGNRRLFYNTKDELQFATHLAALSTTSTSKINRSDTAFFLSYEFLPDHKTILQGVKYLEKDSIAVFSKQLRMEKKRNLVFPPHPEYTDESVVIDKLYTEFFNAVKRQLPSENKVAVLLGGFDSALVAVTLVKLGKQVETFSFEFEDKSYNQAYTEELSALINCRHNWVKITSDVIGLGLKNYHQSFNQPSSLSHYMIQTNHLVKVIKERGFNYCFTGDGCDDIFLGYPTVYNRAKMFERFGHWPTFITDVFRNIIGNQTVENLLGYSGRIARNIFLVLGRKLPVRGFVANRIFDEFSLNNISQEFNKDTEKHTEECLGRVAHEFESLSLVRLAFKGKSMVSTTRNKTEGASISNGVVLQSPYNDVQLKHFAVSISEELLRPTIKKKARHIGKYAFVEMVRKNKLLPEEMIFQKKASPVTSSVDFWFMGALRTDICKYMTNCPFEVREKYIQNMLRTRKLDNYFRKKTLGRYLLQPVSLLSTYSRFFQRSKDKN